MVDTVQKKPSVKKGAWNGACSVEHWPRVQEPWISLPGPYKPGLCHTPGIPALLEVEAGESGV